MLWGHVLIMGAINLHYGTFISSAISCPALRGLQGGALKWGYGLQQARTWIWAHWVHHEPRWQWTRNKGRFFNCYCIKAKGVFPQMQYKTGSFHWWEEIWLIGVADVSWNDFMMIKSLFILCSQSGGEEGNMEDSALYWTQLSIFRVIFGSQKCKVFISNLYLYIHVYGSMHGLAKLRKRCQQR